MDEKQRAADLQWAEVERTKPHPARRQPRALTAKDTILGEFDRLASDLAEYRSRLDPPPADPRVAHPARSRFRVVED